MRLLTVVATLLYLSPNFAQEEIVFDYQASELNGSVYLTWSITQGNTCNGIDIWHSKNAIDYELIGGIEGICGSNAESIAYDFVDNSPELNSINYYKLDLGGLGSYWVEQIQVFDFGVSNSVVFPNPVVDESQIVFQNSNLAFVQLEVTNTRGEVVYQSEGKVDHFNINAMDLDPGIYLYTIPDYGKCGALLGRFQVYK